MESKDAAPAAPAAPGVAAPAAPAAPAQTAIELTTPPSLSANGDEKKRLDDEEVYDPFSHRDAASQYSNSGALAHLLKCSLSTGILAMPLAFKNGGLVFGTLGAIVIGIICTHCVDILVRASQRMCVLERVPSLDMPGTARAAFTHGPAVLRPFARAAGAFVGFALCSTYFVGIVPIVVFVSASVQQLVETHFGKPDMDPVAFKRIFILALGPLLVLLALIRKLKHLVPFSVVANVCMVLGFAITLYYLFRWDDTPVVALGADPSYVPGIKEISLFCSTTLFAMEGIENTMRNPKRMVGWTGVLAWTMVIVCVLYLGMGIIGFLRFGDAVQASITLSLPPKEIPAQVVNALLAVAVTFTFPLQLFVTCDMAWQRIVRPRLADKKYHGAAQTVVRFVLASCVVLMAWAVPNLGPVISLIGSLFLSVLGLFIPAVVDLAAFWGDASPARKVYLAAKNGFIVLLSFFAAAAGSYFSILDIIDTFVPHPTTSTA
ncbi:hypothetical protein ONE63_007041 [Megalurothrips usitatus]|uniref:Amino acid transporter transmembrane domain-containing protein n=1 Tax=Megalurothrips usitatus TaxID=439358 RepID=A0AAV7XQT0_9NEOP|nr:hypothetical protein ONE63_007041 [Megalurothrips usitatus]